MNYKSTRWEKKREHILRRDKHTCRHYSRFGKRVDADTVHHIYPVEFYPEYQWCDWNLISLSNKAHNMMHDRVTHELTVLGKQLMNRTVMPNTTQAPPI